MRLVLLGKPMAGKGTMAKLLVKELGYDHISAGALLREEIEEGSPLGQEIKPLVEKGILVSDELVTKLMAKRLPKDDFILDGYPRSVVQAEQLSEITDLDVVIDVHCSDETIQKRTLGRRTCSECGAIYGIDVPPAQEGVCDKCSGALEKRKDDTLEIISDRLAVYREKTAPLIAYYKEKGLYKQVNADQKIPEILKDMLAVIETVK